MLAVAQLRAIGKRWAECAKATGLKAKTARQYPCRYPGWDALVDHYRREAFADGVREHFHAGSLEALDALRHEFRQAAAQLRELERRAAEGELDPEEARNAIYLSKAVAYSADKYLSHIGFQRYRHRLAEMEAEEEKTGKVGQTVHHELSALDVDLEELTEEELEARIAELEEIVHE